MKLNLKVFHKGLILIGVPLVLEVLVVVLIFALVLQSDRERLEEDRQRRIAENMTECMARTYDLGYGIFKALKGQGDYKHLKENIRQIKHLREETGELTSVDPKQHEQWQLLTHSMDDLMFNMREILLAGKKEQGIGNLLFHISAIRDGVEQMSDDLSTNFRKFVKPSEEYLETSALKQRKLRQMQAGVLLAGSVLSVLFALFLARMFIRDIVERLKVITDNSVRLARDMPLRPVVPGNDEIAQFDKQFHKMATSLQLAAEKERSVFENASDVICVIDANGRFDRLNAACARVLGLAPQELIGKELLDYIYEEDREKTFQAIESTKSGEPSIQFENRISKSDGTLLDALWSVYWSHGEKALFCVAHDISERKQAERVKEEFLAMVSHDLRTPLASIFGVFQLLNVGAFGELPAKAAEQFNMATRNVTRLLALVNDVLDLEKLESGNLQLQREELPVMELIQRSIQDVELIAAEKDIDIHVDGVATTAEFDMDRMIQVLVNLLSNAIKFSPSGGIVTITNEIKGDNIEIRVIDAGRGVPKDHAEVIFERFKQVVAKDGKRTSGTGLGLPICKKIVEQHGGTIGVKTSEDESETSGSTFWLQIPIKAPIVHPAMANKSLDSHETAPVIDPALTSEFPASTGRLNAFSPSNLNLHTKGAILVGVPLIFALILTSSLTFVLVQTDQEKSKSTYLRAISTNGSKLLNLYYEAGTAMSGARTKSAWKRFSTAIEEVPPTRAKLVALFAQDPQFNKISMEAVTSWMAMEKYFARAKKIMGGTYSEMTLSEAFAERHLLMPVAEVGSSQMTRIIEIARKRESSSPQKQEALRRQQEFLLGAGVLSSMLLSFLMAAFFSKGVTNRLAVLSDNAARLADQRPLRPLLSGDDEIAHLDKVFHAMTKALAEARQKERAVFDNSQDVICALDPQFNFNRINPAAMRNWGYSPEELVDRSLFDLIVPEDVELTRKALPQPGEISSTTKFENRLIRKDGTLQDVLWSASWSADEQRLFCVAHDISKRKELERLKKEFLSMVSHDLRTPLAAIVGVARLTTAGAFGEMPEKAKKQMEVVTRNADRLMNLINDLLDMEKLEAGQMQLDLGRVSAAELLERSRQALEAFAQQKNIEIVVEPADSEITADGERLIQVLVNLLSNAIKFSEPGQKVTLAARTSGDMIEFAVQDQGRGVPEEHVEQIFQRYKQVEAVDGKRKSGTGLGLPICKQIVEQHGGSIGVQSAPGAGSRFWFKIPLSATISTATVLETPASS
jgi:PAS domain S-box-containing protein